MAQRRKYEQHRCARWHIMRRTYRSCLYCTGRLTHCRELSLPRLIPLTAVAVTAAASALASALGLTAPVTRNTSVLQHSRVFLLCAHHGTLTSPKCSNSTTAIFEESQRHFFTKISSHLQKNVQQRCGSAACHGCYTAYDWYAV